MFDIEAIISKYKGEDGSIPADAVAKLAQAVSSSVGREFVEKKRYQDKLEEIETLKTEKQTAEDSATTAGKWKEKYETLKGEFDTYKADQEKRESSAAKEKAVRAYLEGKNITGKNLELAMMAAKAQVDAAELEDGKLKDTKALDELVSGAFSGLVSKITVQGAQTSTPPVLSTGPKKRTKEEIMSIKDAGERQRAIAENLELFN